MDEQTRFETVTWAQDELPSGYVALAKDKVTTLLEPLEHHLPVADKKKVCSRAEHVLLELGVSVVISKPPNDH